MIMFTQPYHSMFFYVDHKMTILGTDFKHMTLCVCLQKPVSLACTNYEVVGFHCQAEDNTSLDYVHPPQLHFQLPQRLICAH